MAYRTVVIATRNRGKLVEFQRLFGDLPLRLISLDDAGVDADIEETGGSFKENAVLKAVGYSRAAGHLTLADDSGIEVDALDGAPGVRTARFWGPSRSDDERNRRLLAMLESLPDDQRGARYRAVLALADPARPEAAPLTTEGVCEGWIARAPAGDNGFGFDPVFRVGGEERTMAQLSRAQKDAVSHRGIAARRMRPLLLAMLA